MALSDTRIRALKPKTWRNAYEVADDGGLFVEVMPGGAKVWRYRYRLNGKREKVTIGPYPAIPIADQIKGGKVVTKGARTYHAEHQSLVAAGKSPARQVQADKARGGEDEATVAGFAPRFIADVLSQQRRADTSRRRLNRHLLPTLGNRRLEEVEAGDLLAILDTLKAKGRVQEARQVLILARSFFAHAIYRQRIQRNPASDIPLKMIGKAGSRDRALEPDEIGKLLAVAGSRRFPSPGTHDRAAPVAAHTLPQRRVDRREVGTRRFEQGGVVRSPEQSKERDPAPCTTVVAGRRAVHGAVQACREIALCPAEP